MKKITLTITLFFLFFAQVVLGQQYTFDMENATESGGVVTQTVNGVTMTIGTNVSKSSFAGNTDIESYENVTISFSQAVNIESIRVNNSYGEVTFSTNVGEGNSSKVQAISSTYKTVNLNWTGVTSINVSYKGDIFEYYLDDIKFTLYNNAPPVIGGTVAGQAVNDNGTINPFASITVSDADDASLAASITLDNNAKGVLTGPNLVNSGPYLISFTSSSNLQTYLRNLSFNPTDNRTATSETTTFLVTVSDGKDTATNNTTTVISSAVAPTVASVTVQDDGTYSLGQDLYFTINYDENVIVTTTGGTPQLEITIGTTKRQAGYIDKSGTSSLIFRYTVQNGDLDTDGITIGALDLNGGTLKDAGGKDATLTLNSIGATTGVLVDTFAPTISSVTAPASGTYVSGESLDFTINFDENVTANTAGGTPQLGVTIGDTKRQAIYLSGSGTSALVFRYTVQSGDSDTDGITIGALALNGGTLKDAGDNNATLTLNSIGATTGVFVDAIAPTISSVTAPASGTYVSGESLDFTINYDENVIVTITGGTPQLEVTIGTTKRQASYVGGSGSRALVFTYTVQSGDSDTDGITIGALALNGGTLKDAGGNNATLTLNSIDATTGVLVETIKPDENNILYVNKSVAVIGKGDSWENAIPELADALVWAQNNKSNFTTNPLQIWVAGGTYKPMYSPQDGPYFGTNQNQGNTFLMVNNVQVYGGFAGTETTLAERDLKLTVNKTTLSGDYNDNDVVTGYTNITLSIINNTENAYRVITSAGGVSTACLDGFTIIGGNYNASLPNYTINGQTITYSIGGGGMLNQNSSPSIANCSFIGNTAKYSVVTYTGRGGGAILNENSSPLIINCLFTQNKYTPLDGQNFGGGAIANYSSSPIILNSTFLGNSTYPHEFRFDTAMYYDLNSKEKIYNSIIWGLVKSEANSSMKDIKNTIISYNTNKLGLFYDSNGIDKDENITVESLFNDYANGDFTLKTGSVAVNKGNNTLYTNAGGNLTADKDVTGNQRIFQSTIDIGAYESQVAVPTPDENNILYVNKNATGNGSGNSWAHAIPELADALNWAKDNPSVASQTTPLQVYVAVGTYYPTSVTTDREASFILGENIKIYGGFDPANSITELAHTRIFPGITGTTGTILSGDIDANDALISPAPAYGNLYENNAGNSYHVVNASTANATSLLDGVRISFGNANGGGKNNNGGGLFSNSNSDGDSSLVTLGNSTVSHNSATDGGGVYCSSYSLYSHSNPSSSLVLFTNSTVSNNSATNGGGVYSASITNATIHSTTSLVTFTNSSVSHNSASISGGGVYSYTNSANSATINSSTLVTFTNSTLNHNSATKGGGVYSEYSDVSSNSSAITFTNSTVSNNSASTYGGATYFTIKSSIASNSVININNSLFASNEAEGSVNNYYNVGTQSIKNSYLEGENLSASNSNLNGEIIPITAIFKNPANGDYSLSSTSPAVNAGDNTLYTTAGGALTDKDLAGNARIFDGSPSVDKIDIGAYELQGEPINIKPKNNIVYVNKNVSGGDHTGADWLNAVPELADALIWANVKKADFVADTPLQIWVASGTYKPLYSPENGANFGTDQTRDNAFLLVKNVQLYGGFSGKETETEFTNRDVITNKTVLSGDIGTDGDNADNTYHVVISTGEVGTASLDGFTVTGGNANNRLGRSIKVNYQYVGANTGGGMFVSESSPSILNTLFTGNNAYAYGGGLNVYSSRSTIINSNFNRNKADYGGGISNYASTLMILNTTFSGNSSSNSGDAIYNNPQTFSFLKIYNSIVWGDIFNGTYSIEEIKNSILKGRDDVTNGNIDARGLSDKAIFNDPANGDYSLNPFGVAINAGDNALYTSTIATDKDLAGNDRLFLGLPDSDKIDMGAYEYQGELLKITPTKSILYVNKTAIGNKTGDSWDNAIPELADALVWAHKNQEDFTGTPLQIWVAGGTYKPMYSPEDNKDFSDGGRNNTFLMVNNVQVYGGFAGTETLAARNLSITANQTILSGDIGTVDDNTDNTYHVMVSAGDVGAARLDGFAITGGYASSIANYTVNTKDVYSCSGAGIYNSESNPLYLNLTIKENSCFESGGGMFSYKSTPNLQNVTIENNQAKDGGGMTNQHNSVATLLNVIIKNNNASEYGSGLYNVDESNATLINTSIVGNNATINSETEVEGSASQNSFVTLKNSIVWDDITGDFTAEYSLIKDKTNTDNGNIDATGFTDTAIFNDPTNGDYTLKNASPAVNTGDNSLYTAADGALTDNDLAGNKRIFQNTIDMGAYESQIIVITPGLNNVLYVKKTATGDNSGDSWDNAVPELADALVWAHKNKEDFAKAPLQIWVAGGTYKPMYSPEDNKDFSDGGRNNTFLMVNNVQVYGGFAGTETLAARNLSITANQTILSGDIGTENDNTDNTYHVMVSAGDVGAARLDGFAITNGFSSLTNNGYITVNAYGIEKSNGAGITTFYSSPTIVNVSIFGNAAKSYGGGMCNEYSSPIIKNVTIYENTSDYGAGVMNVNSSNPTFTNVTISNNKATSFGGGMVNVSGGISKINNTIIWGNIAGRDNNLSVNNSAPKFSYCLIEDLDNTDNGGLNGKEVNNAPQFKDAANGDYNLKNTSPAVNAGDNSLYTAADGALTDNDLAGNARIFDGSPSVDKIDIGAYELQENPFKPAPTTTYATQVYAGDDKTVKELQVTGTAIIWYDEATAGSVVETTTFLSDGTIYYASQTLDEVESTERIAITVQRISDANQNRLAASTVADLVSTPATGTTVAWFSEATGGTALNSNHLLSAGTYYVEQNSAGVLSNRVAVTVDVAPAIITFSPPANATGVTVGSSLEITFNENVAKGTGSITIYSDNSVMIVNVFTTDVTVADNKVTITTGINFEKSTVYYVKIDANAFTDVAGNPFAGFLDKTTWSFTTELNLAPTAITLSKNTIDENVAANSTVGTLSSTDVDSHSFTYNLVSGNGDTDNASFTIDGDELKIKSSPDFETKEFYTVLVRTTDQGGLSSEKQFTISITNVNEAPTAIALSNSVIAENVIANSTVGTLSSTDVDTSDTFEYSLVAGTGATDNALFTIDGDALKINASPNYKAKSSYTVRVRTTDQGGLTFEKEFTITVNDIDESLGDIVLSTLNINENVGTGTVVGALSSIGEATGNIFTYELVSGADDNGVFGISGADLVINTALDFETKNSYSVVIRKKNQFGATFERQFTITVNNVNEAPTAIALSATSIAENLIAGSTVGSLSSTDVDSGDAFTYSLASGVLDNNFFSISGSDLIINASPDFETTEFYTVLVRTTDQGGLTFEKEFTITVNDIDESLGDIVLSTLNINENVGTGIVVGALSSIGEATGNIFTYELVSGADDNGVFGISGTDLVINTALDFETKNSYSVVIRKKNQFGATFEKQFIITVNDVNESPTAIALSKNTIDENVAANATVGILSSTDVDVANTFTYSLVSGSVDNALFSILGDKLILNVSPDFETTNSYTVLVKTTDQDGLSFEENFIITVNDVKEVPAEFKLSKNSIDENVTAGSTVGSLSSTDIASDAFTYSLVSGIADNALFSISGNDLIINTSPDFENKSSYSIRIKASGQGGLSFEENFIVTVNDLSYIPSLTFENISKTYGDNFDLGATSNSAGSVSYDVISGGTGAATLSGANNKTVTLVTAGTVNIRATQVANGDYALQTKDIVLTITQKPITVTATSQTKVYGTTDPVFVYSVSPSLVGTDAFTGSLSRAAGENVGSYAITQGSISAGVNYNITYNTADFSISKADQTTNCQPNLIRQQFADVIFFDNSSKEFKSFAWYKNGALVSGQNLQYYKETGGLNGSYYAMATKIDGTVITTCPLMLASTVVAETIKIVPNPVRSDASFELVTTVENSKMENAKINIFAVNGVLLKSISTNESTTTLQAPTVEGIYIVTLTLSNGSYFTKNLLVKN